MPTGLANSPPIAHDLPRTNRVLAGIEEVGIPVAAGHGQASGACAYRCFAGDDTSNASHRDRETRAALGRQTEPGVEQPTSLPLHPICGRVELHDAPRAKYSAMNVPRRFCGDHWIMAP
jgi:hypothetical protein